MNNESRNKMEEHYEMITDIEADIMNIKDQEQDPDTKLELEALLGELTEVGNRVHGLSLG